MVFGLPNVSLHSAFAASTIAISSNVAKQVLFRLSALVLQICIFKACSLLASSRNAFTSYLMFTEDYIQRTLYVFSRGFSSSGVIVLLLTILLFIGNWFDALLWGLDSPGYLAQKSNVTAAKIADRILPEPGYLVFSNSAPGDVDALDARLVDMLGSNLFQPGVNFSLTGRTAPSTPKTVPPTQAFADAGPRIWLGDDGFSLSADSYITFAVNKTDVLHSTAFDCPWRIVDEHTKKWNCTFDNSFSYELAADTILGRPEVHWDDARDKKLASQYISPARQDNPWDSLGKGGDTALMMQMFTVTKDRMRHTFIETAWKACMLTDWRIPFELGEVTDLVKRTWSTDPAEQSAPFISQVAHSIIDARSKNSSGTFGFAAETETSVSQVNYELLNVETVPGTVGYSLFRLSLVNITLVRSEELPQPPTPFEPCDKFYSNIAQGGRVRMTDCYLAAVGAPDQQGHRFLGQVDTSAFLILNGILGQGRFNSSEKALNQKAWEWLLNNEQRLHNLVLSRGALLAWGPGTVEVEVSNIQPAISRLQILLMVLSAVLAGAAWLSLILFAKAHYSSSLLANLVATTMVTSDGEDAKCGKPRYSGNFPEIKLLGEDASRMVMATETGVFRHISFDAHGAADGLILGEGVAGKEDENGLTKTTTISQYEVVQDQEHHR